MNPALNLSGEQTEFVKEKTILFNGNTSEQLILLLLFTSLHISIYFLDLFI